MDINILLKRSGLKSSDTEIEILKKDLENIVQLLEDIPEPTYDSPENEFVELHEDEYEKDATKEEILSAFHVIEKDMIKVA